MSTITDPYTPKFPHPHYHSYNLCGDRIDNLNPVLRLRAEDIALICNLIGAKSIVDVGSNLGGFLFYFDKFGRRKNLLGIEGQPEFARECMVIAGLINSPVAFQISDVMAANVSTQYDAIILQNVYHYIFDRVGNHDEIFRKFARLGKSIIWYNPMSPDDPVIPKHANSNRSLDWSTYNKRAIFQAAISAGFLHPIPLPLRFRGMGEIREHWLFVLDQPKPLRSRRILRSHIRGEPQELKPHFQQIHAVLLDDARSYKTFIQDRGQMSSLLRSIDLGILDGTVCDTIDIIVDDESKVPVGYSQPRGIPYAAVRVMLGEQRARSLFITQTWRLVSRMLRHDAFYHDIGPHNAVFPPFRLAPILIDVDGIIFDTNRQLSLYRKNPNDNELQGAANNLSNLFPGIALPVGSVEPTELFWLGMQSEKFLADIDLHNIVTV